MKISKSKIQKEALVIGGGISGLATAALLGKEGYKVTVLEKNNTIGGRARQLKKKGYKFDMGPSWYMMPDVFESYFANFNKKTKDFYKLRQLPVHYKIFFSNSSLEISAKNKVNERNFESMELGAAENLKRFTENATKVYDFSMDKLVYMDYESYVPLLNPSTLFRLPGLGLHKSFHKHVSKYFKNIKLQKAVEFHTVFLGGSPYNTPAFYTLVNHTDFKLKLWHPMGGVYEVIKALSSLCETYGVEIRRSEPVVSIKTKGRKIKSIETKKSTYYPDLVVNSADMNFVDEKLLDSSVRTRDKKYWKSKTMSPSSILVYLGVKGNLKNVDHHNLFLDRNWDDHFETVYSKPSWPKKPSYYVHVPTVTDKSLAPKGSHVVTFLIPVAAGLKDKNMSNTKKLVKTIISHFEEATKNDLEGKIEVKRTFSVSDFKKDYNAYKGSAFGLAHTLRQTAFLRPRNRHKKLDNLWFTGQYTNPGIGVPTALISSQITFNSIQKWNKKKL
jgi:phytoene desaturase